MRNLSMRRHIIYYIKTILYTLPDSLIVPYRARKLVVHQREHGLHIAIVQSLRCTIQVPACYSRKSVLWTKGPRTKLCCHYEREIRYTYKSELRREWSVLTKNKGYSAPNSLFAIKCCQLAAQIERNEYNYE